MNSNPQWDSSRPHGAPKPTPNVPDFPSMHYGTFDTPPQDRRVTPAADLPVVVPTPLPPAYPPATWQGHPQGYQGYPPMVPAVAPVFLVGQKSVAGAAVLGFLFGPLGMLYSTVLGAAVMFGVAIVVTFLTFGLGLFLVWPACAIWAGVAASEHNRRLLTPAGFAQTGYLPPNYPPGY